MTFVKFIKAQGNRLPGNDSSIWNSSGDKAFQCHYQKPYWISLSFHLLNEDVKYAMVLYLKKIKYERFVIYERVTRCNIKAYQIL